VVWLIERTDRNQGLQQIRNSDHKEAPISSELFGWDGVSKWSPPTEDSTGKVQSSYN